MTTAVLMCLSASFVCSSISVFSLMLRAGKLERQMGELARDKSMSYLKDVE